MMNREETLSAIAAVARDYQAELRNNHDAKLAANRLSRTIRNHKLKKLNAWLEVLDAEAAVEETDDNGE